VGKTTNIEQTLLYKWHPFCKLMMLNVILLLFGLYFEFFFLF